MALVSTVYILLNIAPKDAIFGLKSHAPINRNYPSSGLAPTTSLIGGSSESIDTGLACGMLGHFWGVQRTRDIFSPHIEQRPSLEERSNESDSLKYLLHLCSPMINIQKPPKIFRLRFNPRN